MSDLKFRPRFQLFFKSEEQEIIQQIKEALRHDNPEEFQGKVRHGHFTIWIHPEKKHFWSPVLDISFEKMEDKQTQMRCLLAPTPTVWTMFMFGYFITIFSTFIGLMIGSSQWYIGAETMWGLYLAAIAALLSIAFFMIAQSGKKLATEEMKNLKDFIFKVKEKIH
ncbi:hypothetical protein DNU06_07635 [Putridiphycobacter roseus]|uniref:GTP-binding protein n=1 Tax=Putridiphycobacter roseus TaxID=2219161 RepID=A0A2W1NPY9_9FLAO|nr:hypothetical protein [Putridiphycobacter roseus]PZE17692.1 hypothetical protein DNU06_07635 [Putridiphycobacter roseus]